MSILSIAFRDVEDMVSLEAIRLLFGANSSQKAVAGPAGNAAETRNVKLRVRAWLCLSQFVSHARCHQTLTLYLSAGLS